MDEEVNDIVQVGEGRTRLRVKVQILLVLVAIVLDMNRIQKRAYKSCDLLLLVLDCQRANTNSIQSKL